MTSRGTGATAAIAAIFVGGAAGTLLRALVAARWSPPAWWRWRWGDGWPGETS